jgi:predicted MFS family arabinose efflux permease
MTDRVHHGRRLPLYALVASSGISLTGNVLATVAIPWFVLETSGSAALAGVSAFAVTIPIAIGSLVAGRVVDLVGPRRTVILADLVSAVTVAGIPALHGLGALEFGHLVVLAFGGALFDAAGQNARMAMLPELADEAGTTLERVTSLNTAAEHVGYLVGAPLGGILIVAIGAPSVLWLDAASFLVSVAIVALAVRPRATRDGRDRDEGSLRGALGYLRRDEVVLMLLVYATLASLVISSFAPLLLPVYARTVLGNPLGLGLSVAAYGVGGLTGTFVYGSIGARLPRGAVFAGLFALAWIPFAFLAVVQPGLGGLLIASFATGVWPGVLAPLSQTVRLERIPVSLRDRVIGLTTAAFQVVGPMAILITGVLIEGLGLSRTLLIVAAGEVALAVFIAVHPATRRMERADARNDRGRRPAGVA